MKTQKLNSQTIKNFSIIEIKKQELKTIIRGSEGAMNYKHGFDDAFTGKENHGSWYHVFYNIGYFIGSLY